MGGSAGFVGRPSVRASMCMKSCSSCTACLLAASAGLNMACACIDLKAQDGKCQASFPPRQRARTQSSRAPGAWRRVRSRRTWGCSFQDPLQAPGHSSAASGAYRALGLRHTRMRACGHRFQGLRTGLTMPLWKWLQRRACPCSAHVAGMCAAVHADGYTSCLRTPCQHATHLSRPHVRHPVGVRARHFWPQDAVKLVHNGLGGDVEGGHHLCEVYIQS